jgi:hypothetical protein
MDPVWVCWALATEQSRKIPMKMTNSFLIIFSPSFVSPQKKVDPRRGESAPIGNEGKKFRLSY